MLFQHTLDLVLSGAKTQTRRIALPHADGTGAFDCEMIGYPMGIMSVQRLKAGADKWRTVYQVGKDYAVCPGRGKAQVARIQITDIRRCDVREISDEDALAEGFKSYREFLALWVRMHDKRWWMPKKNNDANLAFSYHRHMMGFLYLKARPAEHYQAWALTFALVK